MKRFINKKTRLIFYKTGLGIMFLLIVGCDMFTAKSSINDRSKIVAEVGKSDLKEKDLRDLFGNSYSSEDSIRATNNYIRRWVKEELIKIEAEKTMKDDRDIQRMVEDYRKSLLIHKFEQELAREKLDSNISEQEIALQYKKNKASFILAEPIYTIRWIVITNANISPEQLEEHWKENKYQTNEKWVKLAELYANNYNLDPSIWWRESELLSLLPVKNKEFLNRNQQVTKKSLSEDEILLVDVLKVQYQGDLAPIGFVKDDIKSYILHQRKEAFLREFREKLYENAVNSNAVKINLK